MLLQTLDSEKCVPQIGTACSFLMCMSLDCSSCHSARIGTNIGQPANVYDSTAITLQLTEIRGTDVQTALREYARPYYLGARLGRRITMGAGYPRCMECNNRHAYQTTLLHSAPRYVRNTPENTPQQQQHGKINLKIHVRRCAYTVVI